MSDVTEAANRLKAWEDDCESARSAGVSVELPWSRYLDMMAIVNGVLAGPITGKDAEQ